MTAARYSTEPFAQALSELLAEHGLSMRAMARELGGLDHAYLSRMARGERAVNVEHLRRIAVYFGLPDFYFPEVREHDVIDAIRSDPQLRDELFFQPARRGRGR